MTNSEASDTSILSALGVKPEDGKSGGPRQQFCGDIDIRIGTDGTWYYLGTPIGRIELVKLFSTVLKRDADGDYWLETPVEKARITVDDAPFTIITIDMVMIDERPEVLVETNLGEQVTLDGDHPLWVEAGPGPDEPRPYVAVRDGLNALVTRAVFYEMVNTSAIERIDGKEHAGLWSKGLFFSLGTVTEPA